MGKKSRVKRSPDHGLATTLSEKLVGERGGEGNGGIKGAEEKQR